MERGRRGDMGVFVLVFYLAWDVRPPAVPLSSPVLMDTYQSREVCESSLLWLKMNYPKGEGYCWGEKR